MSLRSVEILLNPKAPEPTSGWPEERAAAHVAIGSLLEMGAIALPPLDCYAQANREFATAGRLLRTAHRQEAVLFTPLLPTKALPGLGPDPLPKQLTNPSQRLLERITNITGPLTANRN